MDYAAIPLLAKRLRARRQELGFSAKQVYTRTGISRAYLWALENRAGINPSAALLERIARVLDTSTTYLLGRTETVQRGMPISGVPAELSEAAAQLSLTQDDIRMLLSISWRGRRPRTKRDWLFLAEALDRTVSYSAH